MAEVLLETVHLRKEYPGTVALEDVSLQFRGGTIHALLGKNGAGKSTLVKILTGAILPTAGTLQLNGKRIAPRSPADALRIGIAAVYQEMSLVPDLSVAENILLGRLPHNTGSLRVAVDWQETVQRAQKILHSLEVELDVHTPVRQLSVAQQQLVEIAKAMSHEPSVLLLDEPTSALSHDETRHLFGLLRTLVERGVALIYITHRLQEIHRIAHVATVLRDGMTVGTIPMEELSPARLVEMMFGEKVRSIRGAPLCTSTRLALEVRHLSRGEAFHDVSFSVREGEIVGIAGVLGSGRTELLRALFGADAPSEGEITLGNHTLRPTTPEHMRQLGLAFAPENRKEDGLVQLLSTRENICLASLFHIAPWGITTVRREQAAAAALIRDVDAVVPDMEAAVSSLSGGNQQKVVIGKWLNTHPRLFLLDEPTRGIDVRAKQQIFELLWELSRKGIGSVVVSSELEELLVLCHRILIMKNGRIESDVDAENTSLEHLFSLCMR